MKTKWIEKLDHWIFESYNIAPDDLALCRISYALFNLFFLFHFNFSWIATYPDVFYHAKPGLTFFFDGFPPAWILKAFNIILSILNFFLLFGKWTKPVSILISLTLIISFSFVFAFGNTYHVIMWIIFPAIMAFTNWGAKLSLDSFNKKETTTTWPITLMSILIGFAFFTSGLAKLLGGWLQTGGSASWQYFHMVRSKIGRDLYLSDFIASINNSCFWETLDWLVVCFEIGFLLAVFSAKSFRFFICLAILFHFANLLILNISFGIHLVIFMVFIHWNIPEIANSSLFKKIKQKIHAIIKTQSSYTISCWIMLYLLLFFSYENHSRVDGIQPIEVPVYTIGICAVIYYFYTKIKSLF